MPEKSQTLLVVSPGPALRWAVGELKRRYGYRLHYATDPYEAERRLENMSVDAVVCEASPAYTAECRFLREVCQRSAHLAVILFVEPESEEYLLDELRHCTFQVVRPVTPLEEVHRLLQAAIAKSRRLRAA